MFRSRPHIFDRIALIGLLMLIVDSQNVSAQQQIAQDAYAIFEQSCLICHGPDGAYRETLLIEQNALIENGTVIPGNPEASELYLRLLGSTENGPRMPLGQPPLSAEAIDTIRSWILAGAPDWAAMPTPTSRFITPGEILDTIETHLMSLTPFDRAFARYFTLTHLLNAGERAEVIQEYRSALSKLINSLSWGLKVINPQPIDPQATIFYIDLRHYEWDRQDGWTLIEKAYPYPIFFDAPTQTPLREQLTRLQTEMNCEVPSIHIDWFLATASTPPLYHQLLSLPLTDRELETRLDVDVIRNLLDAPGVRVWRAGFNNSGVSNNNRVVERHTSRYGAYWKSYDFAGSVDTQNIFAHPLSFTHDGGEIIFNLPNGFQGYYLVNASGSRLDEAPINIVSNPAASDPTVRNGLSCFGCHTEGMKTFDDQVRPVIESNTNPPYDQAHALRLYVKKSDMDTRVQEDMDRFRQALEATGGVFGGLEPIQRFHEVFQGPVAAAEAAAAVGLETEVFLEKIRENVELQNIGLLVLDSENGSMKRDTWTSGFRNVMFALDFPKQAIVKPPVGTPPYLIPGRGVHIPDSNLRALIEEVLETKMIRPDTMARLTTLKASNRDISDLTGLEFAINLEELWISRNPISDLSPLAGCINLIRLHAWDTPISDLSPLANLTKLELLHCVEGLISDMSPLAGLTNLKYLTLYTQRLSDISPIASLTNLRGIRLTHNDISDLSPLASLINLEMIAIYDNQISDISPLAKLTQLDELRIQSNQISDLSPLRNLTNLTHLDMASNKISDISPLSGLINLRDLTLANNQISDASPLSRLINLDELHFQYNQISDVSPLSGLINLNHLDLTHNLIETYAPIAALFENANIFLTNNPGFPSGGPKIEGPWLWTWVSSSHHHGWDLLEEASGGTVTELQIATDGATEGAPAGESVWTKAKLSPVGDNNIRELTDTLGWGPGRELYDIVLYGCINLYSPREQKTTMYLGCDDGAFVWLNGKRIFSKWRSNGNLTDYNIFFPVTLKQGKNVLLAALDDRNYQRWSAFFGFAPDTEYAVAPPSVGYAFSETPIHVGDTFILDIHVENVFDLAGWQFDIAFDPAALQAIDVNEGDFMKADGGTTFFQGGRIDNASGKITGLIAAGLSDRGVSGSGSLIEVRFKAKSTGETELALHKFQFGSITGASISAGPHEIRITVEQRLLTGDVNRDGQVSILDLILVAQQFGKNVPANSPVDVNRDGVVNIFDLIHVAQGFAESPAAPAVATENITPALIEAWIALARLEDDGSVAFQQGILNLVNLLAELKPDFTALHPNYPNPFNPETWIPYQLAMPAEVTLTIYDMNGQTVRHLALGHQAAGMYQSRSRAVYWDGRNQLGESVASGLYFYTLTAGEFTATRKMLIRK